jgi:hypothetical protein
MMTTKTAKKSDPAFVAALARVHPALSAWRQRRKPRQGIPKALWKRMAKLAGRYGVSPVAQSLGVNYTSLKDHLVGKNSIQGSNVSPGPAAFLEVPVTAWPNGPQWVIELEDRSGAKLTLRLGQGDAAAALSVAQGLWSSRRA